MAKPKPKKWSNLVGKYPAADPAKGEGEWFQGHVVPKMRDLEEREVPLKGLMELLTCQKRKKAERERRISIENNAAIRACELLILKHLERSGLESVRAADGGLFTKSNEPSFKVTDPEKVDKWIDDNGYQDLRKVDANTLKALFRKALDAGEDVPDGVDISVATLLKSPKPEVGPSAKTDNEDNEL